MITARQRVNAFYVEIGLMVKSARIRRCISQSTLAALTGTTVKIIRRLEDGDLSTNGSFMEKVAKALEVPYQEIYPDIEDLGEWLQTRGIN